MSPRAAAFLLIAVLTTTAHGQDWSVPTGVHGVEFGATREEAQAVLGRLRCQDVQLVTRAGDPVRDRDPADIAPAHVVCTLTNRSSGAAAFRPPSAFTINERIIDTEYLFDRGRFVAVRFPRPQKLRHKFADVLARFEREYGTPTRTIETPRKGLRDEMIQNRLIPTIYDYVETCVHWTNAPVAISICSEDRMFRRGRIETAEWWLRKQELVDNLPEQ